MDARGRVAWNLRKARVARGQSQQDLALSVGLDTSYVGRLERGTENPSVGVIEALAGQLGLDVCDLLVLPPPDETPPAPLRAGRRKAR